jgi:hypothetical protein
MRLIPRVRAFEARGVSLKYPSRSRSGVRADDGTVILAIRARDLRRHRRGSRCVVWTPDEAQGAMDPVSRDLLEHCRLAALRGNAEALLTYGEGAKVDPDVVLPLRVVRRGEEYWAEISA